MLNTIVTGETNDAVPLLIAHGLFGSARNWGVVAKRLAAERQVIAVDMRNHGASPHFETHSYAEMADDLAAVIDGIGRPVAVMGHSMGGKAAMVLALNRPELVAQLTVVDIAPVTYQHTQMPVVDAMRSVDLSRVGRRADADVQLAEYLDDPALRAFLLQSLDVSGDQPQWRLNLEVLAAEMAKIIGFPEVPGQYDGAVDFVLGARSDYVTGEGWAVSTDLFPGAQRHVIEGAGHWVHAEAPRPFVDLVARLLQK